MLDLIKRISITRDPALDGTGYHEGNPVEIEMNDGTVLRAWGKARGSIENPVPREDVLEKFRKVTARQLDRAAQDAIIAQCARLETLDDATALIAALPRGAVN